MKLNQWKNTKINVCKIKNKIKLVISVYAKQYENIYF